jgi:hypothetical protein
VTNGINGTAGADGEDGVSVDGASINNDGHLVIVLSDGTTIDAGVAKGADGTSIVILGSFTDSSQLPSTGQQLGDCYLINGDLWVYTNTSAAGSVHGFENVGRIQGPDGRGIVALSIVDGDLYATYSDS